MIDLVLKDGVTLHFTDTSTIYNLVGVYEDFADIDPIRGEFTVENLDGAIFNGEPVENVIPVGMSVSAGFTGNITVTFNNRAKTQQELIDEEQDAAINMLMGL